MPKWLQELKKLILEGKSGDEVTAAILGNETLKDETKSLTANEIAEAIVTAQKSADVIAELAKRKKATDDAQKLEAEKSAQDQVIKKEVENHLKALNLGALVASKADGTVTVGDNWREEMAEGFKLACKVGLKKATSSEIDKFQEHCQKNLRRWAEKLGEKAIDGVITGTDNVGGYFMPPQFDSEVDKLTYVNSAILNAIRVRPGGEKTEINSIGTFDLSFRTDENTAFGATKPSFAQQELKYRDAGAIVPVSNRAIDGSFYNLTSELIELAADARIRLLEPLLLTGSVDVDSDPFDGIRFHTGVTAYTCLNDGNSSGSGKLLCADLTNAYLACAAQTRAQGVFIMDSREAVMLSEEKDSNGNYLKAVEMVNGQYIHKPTGKPIILVETLPRTLNGVTDHSTGTDVFAAFAVLPRYRVYQLSGFRIDMSKEFYFDYDATAMRFILSVKQGIPTQSRSSFVTIQGVKYNVIGG